MGEDFLTLLRHGRLELYLGMAAGVGKTLSMLREAKRLRAEGIDVVCGFVETHGRSETDAALAGLESVPRQTIQHHGAVFEEMDLDAILARRPDVALVDEIAHTNVPGSVHTKRHEDVDALLEAGISVIGTLNVQHLESLHDAVLRETGIDVRELVPDRFLHRADRIVVIDMAPEQLRERVAEGRLYAPEQVESGLSGFFRPGTLSALRRIAHREVANAIDVHARARVEIVLQHRGGERGSTTRSAGALEPVMVCISSQTTATRALLARAARLAGGLETVYAVAVRTPDEAPERLGISEARSLADSISLATEMGATVVRLEDGDAATALARFVRDHGIVFAVFGRTHVSAWRGRLHGSVLDRFMRLVPEVDVVVVGETRGRVQA